MINLNYQIDNILQQIFRINLSTLLKHIAITNYPPIKIYVNKIENRITFNKTKYYLEVLTPRTMKLLESTEKR